MSPAEPAWPNLFLVGAHKSGTTSLHRYLDDHPEIFMSHDKDGGFLVRLAAGEAGPEEPERYLHRFADADDLPVRGDASVQYLHNPDVPALIHDRVPDARILVSLRDPIQRAYSHYWRRVAGGTEDAGFVEAVEREIADREAGRRGQGYLANGEYAGSLARYVDTFGDDRVHVMLLADLKEDAVAALEAIFDFLDVDPGPAERIDASQRRNTFRGVPYGGLVERVRTSATIKSVARRVLPQSVRDWLGNQLLLKKDPKPPVPEEARRRLAEHFEPDIRDLEELLDRDLGPLRASFPDDDR